MEHDLRSLLLKACQWYIHRHFSESNAAGKREREKPTAKPLFQPPALTIVFREGKTEEEAIKEIADIYINRHSYTNDADIHAPEEKEYLKFENINFDKLEKINIQ